MKPLNAEEIYELFLKCGNGEGDDALNAVLEKENLNTLDGISFIMFYNGYKAGLNNDDTVMSMCFTKNKMQAQQAKEEALLVWKYLAEHPEITRKIDLPDDLYIIITDYCGECPLCEYFKIRDSESTCERPDCSKCPLKSCDEEYSAYYVWLSAKDTEKRKQAAEAIVKAIEEWEAV